MITKDMIERAKQDAAAKKREAEALEIDFAIQQCPLKVGQVIPCRGYTRYGKDMLVERILPGDYWEGDWRVKGRVYKADGSLGVAIGETTQRQYERSKND